MSLIYPGRLPFSGLGAAGLRLPGRITQVNAFLSEDLVRCENRCARADSERDAIGWPGAHDASVRKHQVPVESSAGHRCDAGAEELDVYRREDVTEKIVRKRTERGQTLLRERDRRRLDGADRDPQAPVAVCRSQQGDRRI